ncbi:hypothetical protein EW146_g3898 [Bondarzewia mesenterica]|uniref:Uncharacterized protein n=1 Tax=Bondarzewia mesenterica TaxID=1095465 RepID=A0A4S4LW73_9AGAM|nr:hypothetical protein EW146_g3898 [Bondarzewia mesenterica]
MPPPQNSASPIDSGLSTPSVSNSAHKKTSMLSLGPLLKGSSSRRNLQGDKSDGKSGKESTRGRDTDKEKAERPKKDGEGRISVLIGRRRGKVWRGIPTRREPEGHNDDVRIKEGQILKGTRRRVGKDTELNRKKQ